LGFLENSIINELLKDRQISFGSCETSPAAQLSRRCNDGPLLFESRRIVAGELSEFRPIASLMVDWPSSEPTTPKIKATAGQFT
jgi:hypothetical protein